MRHLFSLSLLLLAATAFAQTPLLQNGGFEATRTVALDANGQYSNWKLGDPPTVADKWVLNSHYIGTLTVLSEGAKEGQKFVRMTSPQGGSAHLYQPLQGVKLGQWYRVSLWVRGGPFEMCVYQYFPGHMNAPGIASVSKGSTQWRQQVAYYQPRGEGFQNASLAISTGGGNSLDIDGVTIEPLALPAGPANVPPITFSNDTLTWSLGSDGYLKSFVCKATGKDYAATDPVPLLTVHREGLEILIHSVTREGDKLNFQFLEPSVKVSLQIVTRPTHFLVEVASVEPADVESLSVSFPVKRLEKVGLAFGATYGKDFGACLFCAGVNSHNTSGWGKDSLYMGGSAEAEHKLVGAKWVLIGAPAAQFKTAIIDAEKANGLPCPIKEGQWMRDHPSNRKSYLFATSVDETQIDTLIKYAKIGGFRQIIFLKDSWLKNHGHYEINPTNFKDGIASVQRAVKKIHAAGLEAGVHVFGPSISPNDPYITPNPHPNLAVKNLAPLAEALDEKATTVTLTATPEVDLEKARYQGFPGYSLRIGDEIINYAAVEAGPPYKLVRCQRGAYGTKAVAHAAGEPVKQMLKMWDFFAVDPDSPLADELTTNFANVINACDFDFVYFDASDGFMDQYGDRWYYLNKMHLGFFTKFRKPMLYQTSNGTGSDLCWHMVPRSASADGHGDLKGYLDERWPGILGMNNNWTSADIGWYYWFSDVRPDQMEYICARVLGIDGSISMETSVAATDRLAQSRQLYEAMGRWDAARAEKAFGPAIKQKLLEPKRDFKLFGKPHNWQLCRAAYEEPRIVDALDGDQSVWTINNDSGQTVNLGFELVRQGKPVAAGDYDDPQAAVIDDFSDLAGYAASARNDYGKFVLGDRTVVTPQGVLREGMKQTYSRAEGRAGGSALALHGQNTSDGYGWTGLGRRFDQPRDLTGFKALGVWLHGDAKGEYIRLQLRDTAGRSADWVPQINFSGWKLLVFPLPATGFDFSKVEYALFYFNNVPPATTVDVKIGPLKLLPKISEPAEQGQPVLEINGKRVPLPTALKSGQALSAEGDGKVTLWPGGMAEGKPVKVSAAALKLRPGTNRIKLLWSDPANFPGNLQVLMYRVWPLEK